MRLENQLKPELVKKLRDHEKAVLIARKYVDRYYDDIPGVVSDAQDFRENILLGGKPIQDEK